MTHTLHRYVSGYLSSQDADDLLAWLLSRVEWRDEELWMFGRRVAVPRRVAFFGEPGLDYRYAGCSHLTHGWPTRLRELAETVAPLMGHSPNFVLLNRYRSGSDHMGWHRDDEDLRGDEIVTISLGATRRFLLSPQEGGRSLPLDLEHGSLLAMNRFTRHCLPRTRRPVGERVSLTFRSLG